MSVYCGLSLYIHIHLAVYLSNRTEQTHVLGMRSHGVGHSRHVVITIIMRFQLQLKSIHFLLELIITCKIGLF